MRAYNINDCVIERMGQERWEMTIGWAKDEAVFAGILEKYRLTMQAVVYTRHGSDVPLAVGLIIVENWKRRIAMFHGGGWNSPWDNYDCARLIVAAMKRAGWHVKTSVACGNRRARRFVTSIGLKHYRTENGMCLYRL